MAQLLNHFLQNSTFKQDNAQPRVAGIVPAFLDSENVLMPPLFVRFSHFSHVKTSMILECLVRHHTRIIAADELWNQAV